jgi:hypothetical protein
VVESQIDAVGRHQLARDVEQVRAAQHGLARRQPGYGREPCIHACASVALLRWRLVDQFVDLAIRGGQEVLSHHSPKSHIAVSSE